MSEYIASFYTHVSALKTHRALTARGIEAHMAPVPRELSSSCGTCVQFWTDQPCADALDADTEALYAIRGDGYELLWENPQ